MWEDLKEQKIKCKSEKSDKKLYAYGSDMPLNVLGKFSCNVSLNAKGQSKCVQALFYVVKGNGQSLLGKFTAQELGVLKLGVNTIV